LTNRATQIAHHSSTGQRRRIITVAGEGGTGPRKGFGAAAPSTKGESVPARAGTSAAYTADPQTGHVVAAPGISIPARGARLRPARRGLRPLHGGRGRHGGGCRLLLPAPHQDQDDDDHRDEDRDQETEVQPELLEESDLVPVRGQCLRAASYHGRARGVIEVAPVQPATANFAPPTWTGDVTVNLRRGVSHRTSRTPDRRCLRTSGPVRGLDRQQVLLRERRLEDLRSVHRHSERRPVPAGDHETNLNRTPLETTWGVTTPNTCSLFSSNHRSCDGLQGRVSTVTTAPRA